MATDNEKKEAPKLPKEEPLRMVPVQSTRKPLDSKKNRSSSKK